MPHQFKATELSGVRRKLLLGLAVLIALSLASTVANLVSSKKNHEQQAQLASRNMSSALDQSISASVDKIDIALMSSVDFMEDRLRHHGGLTPDEVNAYLKLQQIRVPEVLSIRASDAKGDVQFGPDVKPGEYANWSSRDYFELEKSNLQLGLFVTNPMIGKLSKRWIIALVRRYNHPNGSFAGVVAASVPVDYFADRLSTMDVGRYGSAVLRDSNRALIARFPPVDGPSGVVGSKGFSKELAAAMESGEKMVTYHTEASSDGVERTMTYRRLSAVPFHLVAGQGTKDYLADFQREISYSIAQFVLFLLVLSGVTYLLWRYIQSTTQEREHSRALLRGASDGIHVLDNQGNLVEASDSFFAMLGYERSEGLRLNVSDWNAKADNVALTLLALRCSEPVQSTVLTQYRRKNGTEFPVELNVLPIELQGRLLLFNSSRDITQRVQAAQDLVQSHNQLNALNASLEARVTIRTYELQVALQASEVASRSRAEFLANTSHEIRTPMNSVLGMSYLALQLATDPKQRDYLEKIQHSSAHLMGIIDDILDFSKIDVGKLEIETIRFDLHLIQSHLRSWTEDRAHSKGLTLLTECDADVPRFLMGDPLRVKQILLNFVGNAIKFTERGSVRVRLRCVERNAQDCLIRFEVSDTGIGIKASELPRLFQSFEQADTSITRKYGGTGLGLAISRKLAHLMGGEVGVDSAPDLGSTFWFETRFALSNTWATDTETTHYVGPPSTGLQGRSFLVVDDNAFNQEVARGLLEGVGAHVQTANDGAQAIDMLHAQTFDCVLMDVQMPVMDGLEATRRIRADAQLCATLVIAMTANASGTDRMHCLDAGMNEVLKKPVEPEKIFRMLEGKMQSQSQSQSHALHAAASTLPLTGLPTPEPALPAPLALARWDRQRLQSYLGNTPGREEKLLTTYLESAVECVRCVGQAIDAQDWIAAGAQGHKLKSSSRYVGAMQLADFCESLERAVKRGDAQSCSELAVQVDAEFTELKALMDCETVSV